MNTKSESTLALRKDEWEWVEVLRRAALAGKKAIEANYDLNSRTKITKRGVGGDLTLKIDEESESAIRKSLAQDLGANSFTFVSEEIGEIQGGGGSNSNSPIPVIFCDPLDGSHNAEVGLPLFSIALSVIGLSRKIGAVDERHLCDVDIGFILNVASNDEFFAIKGEGSFHNKEEITKLNLMKQSQRFVTLGIECGDIDYLKRIMRNLNSKSVYKLRVLGSAAISYCLLAEGTFDGLIFVQPNGARTIDSPAGYLIAREAGCVFEDVSGKNKDIDLVEVGFKSRINIAGARNQRTLTRLMRLVRA